MYIVQLGKVHYCKVKGLRVSLIPARVARAQDAKSEKDICVPSEINFKTTLPIPTTMTAVITDPLFKGSTGRNTRGLLRLVILITIAAAAVASRLFSVIRMFNLCHPLRK